MGSVRMDGNEIYGAGDQFIGHADGDYIYGPDGHFIGRVEGDYIYGHGDRHGPVDHFIGRVDGNEIYGPGDHLIGTLDDAHESIEGGPEGTILAAIWFFFVRKAV
ncbi:MAG: hypothetical protein ACLPX5_08125 [Dissulfurispiraceae bacterium]